MNHKPLVWILVAGAVVRVLLIMWWGHADRLRSDAGHPPLEVLRIADEQDYHRLATNFLHNREFALVEGEPCSARPPLYPAMVAAVYFFFGQDNFTAVRSVQGVLTLLLVVLVYLLANRMFDRQVANWSAAMTCFYPSLLGFGNLLLSEVLFAVLVSAAMLPLERHFRSASLAALALFGILLALATLARSVLWPFLPLFAVYLFIAGPSESLFRRFGFACVPVATFVLTLAPWIVRNTRLQQTFTVIDTLGGRNMMMGNYEYTKSDRIWDTIGVHGEQAWDHVLASEHSNYYTLTQGQRDKLAMRRGIDFALANPGLTATRCLKKFFNFWQLERSLVAGLARGYWGQLSRPAILGVAALVVGSYVVTVVAAIFGFIMFPPDDRRMHWFLLLLVGFVCAVHTVVFAHSRYHVSLMQLLFPYSSVALLRLRDVWAGRGSRSFWIAASVALLFMIGWIWEIVFVDFAKAQQQLLS